MTTAVTLAHNFETGHRLPHLPGKCENLHGHSWWTHVTITAPGNPGIVVEFGTFKKALRNWIDTHLDHGLMLGPDDPLVPILQPFGKVHVCDSWPTVENTAAMIATVAETLLQDMGRAQDAHVSRVEVRETHVNTATWTGQHTGDPQ